jgi:hypothetical protein
MMQKIILVSVACYFLTSKKCVLVPEIDQMAHLRIILIKIV